MNGEDFLKFQAEQYQFAGQQIKLYSRYLKRDSHTGNLKDDAMKANLFALQARSDAIGHEHSDFHVDGILPAFNIIHGKPTTVD